jgi:hypothetical protein
MNIPGFTAEASLYKTSGSYRSTGSEFGDLRSGEAIVPAYFPGSATQARCNRCLEIATRNFAGCLATGSAACGLTCIASGPGYPVCFAACEGGGSCRLQRAAVDAIGRVRAGRLLS